MSTNKQRRESERQRLQRQLEERREREVARRRNTTIASVVGAIVVIAAVVVTVVLATHGGDDNKPAAGSKPSATPRASSSTTAPPATTQPAPPLATACAAPSGATAHFAGLTITGANNLKAAPKVAGKATAPAADTACQDLVVGKGAPVTAADTVTIQYVGVLGASGKVFGSTWTSGGPTPNAASNFIPGFKGALIGGNKVTPLRVGGRRVVVIPAKYAYPDGTPDGSIPAGSTLVFLIDLVKVAAG